MPIETQIIPYIFDAGIDQEFDAQVSGEATVAAQSVFRRRGRAQKRLPLEAPYDTSTADASAVGYLLDEPKTLLPVKESLAVQGNSSIRVRQESGTRMVPELYQCQAEIDRIDRYFPVSSVNSPDSCTVNGFVLTVWQSLIGSTASGGNSSGTGFLTGRNIYLRIYEIATGQITLPDFVIETSTTQDLLHPRIEPVGNSAHIYYVENGDDLRLKVVDLSDPTDITIGSEVSVDQTIGQPFPNNTNYNGGVYEYDTTNDGTRSYVAWYELDDTQYKIKAYDEGGTEIASATVTSATIGSCPGIYAEHNIGAVFFGAQLTNSPTAITIFKFDSGTLLNPVSLFSSLSPSDQVTPGTQGYFLNIYFIRAQTDAEATTPGEPQVLLIGDAFEDDIQGVEFDWDLTSLVGSGVRLFGHMPLKPFYYNSVAEGVDYTFPVLPIQKPISGLTNTLNAELSEQPNILAVTIFTQSLLDNNDYYLGNSLAEYGMTPWGRMDVDTAEGVGPSPWRGTVSPLTFSGDDVTRWIWTMPVRSRPVQDSGQDRDFALGVGTNVIDFRRNFPSPRIELGDALYTAGACVQTYSGGTRVREASFHFRPIMYGTEESNPSVVIAADASSNLTPGVYQYATVFERYDANGDLVRSQPSRIVVITVAADERVDVTIRFPVYVSTFKDILRLDLAATQFSMPARIVLFRSESDGTNLLRRAEFTPQAVAATTLGQWPVLVLEDRRIDENLIQETMYTQVELANDPPPAAHDIAEWRNRLVIVNAQDRDEIWISKTKGSDAAGNRLAVEFTTSFVQRISAGIGDIEAVASLDEKLIIFKPDSIYQISGDGPNNGGVGGSFSPPIERSSQTGCINRLSVLSTQVGVFFQARGGIYLLDRGMQINFVGSKVTNILPGDDATPTPLVKRAVVLQELKEVRFLLDDANATVLIYHYRFERWSVVQYFDIENRTSFFVRDIAVHMGKFVALIEDVDNSICNVFEETDPADGFFLDGRGAGFTPNGTAYSQIVGTPNFRLGKLTGFQRVKNIRILCNDAGGHDLRVELHYNDSTTPSATQTFSLADLTPVNTGAYVVRVKPGKQKTRLVRVVLRDLAAGTSNPGNTAGFEAIEVSFQVGLKKGGFRIGAKNKR